MVNKKINIDLDNQFANLKESLYKHFNDEFDVTETKRFIEQHVPKEIVYRSKLLFDTLVTYLIEDSLRKIDNANIDVQTAFFDLDFRKKINGWAEEVGNEFAIRMNELTYSPEPRLLQSSINSVIPLILGGGTIYSLGGDLSASIVSGIVAIVSSAIVFKITFDKTAAKARKLLKTDIDNYLVESQKLVLLWLSGVEEVFNHDFHQFCVENNFESEEN